MLGTTFMADTMKSSRSPVHLLASARDTGSAHEVRAFVQAVAARSLPFDFSLVGYGPAVSVLESTGLPVVRWPHSPQTATARSCQTAAHLIGACRPDALLVGLAYPGFGPDEAILSAGVARNLTSASVQDYWGYIGGFKPGECPGTFFVHDRLAARLTRQRLGPGVRILITGSPRRSQMAAEPGCQLEVDRTRDDQERPLLVYFGQPATFPGCLDNLRLFVQALAGLRRSVRVRFRRHPGDTEPVDRYTALLAQQPHPFECSDPGRPVEHDLLDADVVVTCHSSVGLDHHYLQLCVDRPLAPVLFVTIGGPVRQFLREHVGIPEVPNVRLGLAAGVTRVADLAPMLLRLIDDSSAGARYRKRIVTRLATRRDPCGLIADFFLSRTGQSPHANSRHRLGLDRSAPS